MDLCIAQWQTTGLLREKVAELGVAIEWDTRLAGYQPHGSGVTAQIVDPHGGTETFETDWLVGCDGTRSKVRETAGIGWETDDLRRGFILGDFVADWSTARDRFHVWFAKRGLVSVFQMPGGYWRALVITPDDSRPAADRLCRRRRRTDAFGPAPARAAVEFVVRRRGRVGRTVSPGPSVIGRRRCPQP
jgi:2-polyprenyl-6-methoxyphenol hydroxylase-like FAD-dependent oxidoreductase